MQQSGPETSEATRDPLAWWREARFGMFIHWGLYAHPAGFWQGQPIPSLGEWIMRNGKIPIPEYEAIAKEFNPARFDADAWVALAARAGMKYLVITAKHHDGFAMFKSAHPYNIVDATPFGRDPMAELADACARHGVKLCFYYSQAQDWHAPGGAGHWEEAGEHGWWNQPVEPERFAAYLQDKCIPQVTELLTQYGPIGLIWFDTPVVITQAQSELLRDLVHRLQPECLVSGRVGHGVGDYGSLGDNQIPRGRVTGEWETPATLNDTWGYKSDDHHWKSAGDLITLLVDLASKGVNYLLNVGPTGLGEIPPESVALLEAIGAWMDVNGEAIYGTQAGPYPYELDDLRLTQRGDRLYAMCLRWPDALRLAGLRNRVRRAYLLADPETDLSVVQHHDAELDHYTLEVRLPAAAPDPQVSVVVLELEGEPDIDPALCQQPGGRVTLPAYLAERSAGLEVNAAGVITGWQSTDGRLHWTFRLVEPGTYAVRVILGTTSHGRPEIVGGHTAAVTFNGEAVSGVVTGAEPVLTPRTAHFPEAGSVIGEVTLPRAGEVSVELAATALADGLAEGFTVTAVELIPRG